MGQNKIPRDRQYFNWLYSQIYPVNGETPLKYLVVCEMMNDTEFKIIVPRDENRAADGVQLRSVFVKSIECKPLDEAELLFPNASIFEVLVALAMKAERLIEISPHYMFTIFIENLGLTSCYDDSTIIGIRNKINSSLRKFNNRSYTSRGKGGLFPLTYEPEDDQRDVELWYQMGAYMTEKRMY